MTCRFAHDVGVYVLGALPPADRLDFERHLTGCEPCTRSVREIAGLPGLLGRVDPRVLLADPEPMPDTVLPSLSREVRRASRRRALAALALAAASVAAIVSLSVAVLRGGDSAPDDADPVQTPASEVMRPVGDVPVRATLSLEQVTWGTRLGLTCTYDAQAAGYELPREVDYWLVVRTRDGRTEQVGSWRSVDGTTMEISAGTAADRGDIESVEVLAPGGRVVLRLPM